MCVDFNAATDEEILEMIDGISVDDISPPDWPGETWQDYAAPIVRSVDGNPELIVGTFGFRPKHTFEEGERFYPTMNARAETIGTLRTYAKSWRETRLCLLPTRRFYEPNWESGKHERWAIGMADDAPFCVAGMWHQVKDKNGNAAFSFTQITINADEHPLMQRFHKPGAERRSLVIVPRDSYDDWLNCTNPEFARSMLNLYPAELMKAWPAPKGSNKNSGQPTLL